MGEGGLLTGRLAQGEAALGREPERRITRRGDSCGLAALVLSNSDTADSSTKSH